MRHDERDSIRPSENYAITNLVVLVKWGCTKAKEKCFDKFDHTCLWKLDKSGEKIAVLINLIKRGKSKRKGRNKKKCCYKVNGTMFFIEEGKMKKYREIK